MIDLRFCFLFMVSSCTTVHFGKALELDPMMPTFTKPNENDPSHCKVDTDAKLSWVKVTGETIESVPGNGSHIDTGLVKPNTFYACMATVTFLDHGQPRRPYTAKAISTPFRIPAEMKAHPSTCGNDDRVRSLKIQLGYDYVKLDCHTLTNVRLPPDEYDYLWEKDEAKLVIDEFQMHVDLKGALHFLYTIPEEVSLKPMFECEVQGKKTKRSFPGCQYELAMSDSQSFSVPDPELKFVQTSPHVVRGVRGRTVKLECVAGGVIISSTLDDSTNTSLYDVEDVPEIAWYRRWTTGDVQMMPSKKIVLSSRNRTLTFKEVADSDGGEYFCRARLSNFSATSRTISLTVRGYVRIRPGQQLKNLDVVNGWDVVYKCQATAGITDGTDPPRYSWFVNTQPLHEIDGYKTKFLLSEDNTTIKVIDLFHQDSMCLLCYARNSVSGVWTQGCINVFGPIWISWKPPFVTEGLKSRRINLTVFAHTDYKTPLTHKWRYQGILFPTAPMGVTYDQKTEKAYIDGTKLTTKQYCNLEGDHERIYTDAAGRSEKFVIRLVLLDSKTLCSKETSDKSKLEIAMDLENAWTTTVSLILTPTIAICALLFCYFTGVFSRQDGQERIKSETSVLETTTPTPTPSTSS